MSNMGLFCPVCEFSFDVKSDFLYYKKFKCCRNCAMKWAEPYQSSWHEGWRPESSEIDTYKKERIDLIRSVRRKKHDI